MRPEQEFLTTLETYLGILVRQNERGVEIDIREEIRLLMSMVRHRQQELDGTASWLPSQKGEEIDGREQA